MQGWKLFIHAVRMIFGNWLEVLRIFLVPAVIGIALAIALVGLGASISAPLGMPYSAAPILLFVFLAAFLVYLTIATWCIVAWHRFVLLEELPTGWVPRFHKAQIMSYWGQILKLVLVFIIVALPVGFLVAGFFEASPIVGLLVAVPIYFTLMVFYIRLSPVLPAAAIGQRITFGDALQATRGHAGTFVVLLLSLVGFQLLLQLPIFLTATILPIISAVLSLCASVLASLLNISVLTTLHGHYIEGRPID
jgi:hypothetical protein